MEFLKHCSVKQMHFLAVLKVSLTHDHVFTGADKVAVSQSSLKFTTEHNFGFTVYKLTIHHKKWFLHIMHGQNVHM